MAVIGVDIGTSGCKASAVGADGEILAGAYREYTPKATSDGGQELDSRQVMKDAMEVLRETAVRCGGEKIEAISVSSLGESVVPLSRTGEILADAIIYSDSRGEDVEKELAGRVDRERFFEKTGYDPSRVSSVCRIMWLKKHKPEIYRQASFFLPMNSLLLFLLGAKPHIDYTLASTTEMFDIWEKKWDREILKAARLPEILLPPAVEPGTVVGTIQDGTAGRLGLPRGVLLVAGGHDQQCVSLGAGVIRDGDVLDGMGSVEAVGAVAGRPPDLRLLAKYNLSVEPHVIPGKYSIYGCTMTAGRAVKWFRDCFCQDLVLAAVQERKDVYDLMFDMVPREQNNVIWIPYFSGAGTPFNDPEAKSILLGADLKTGRGELFAALLEGIAFELQLNLECLEAAGVTLGEIHAVGGLAKNERYLRMKADLMGRDIVTLSSNEAGTLGAAILAMKAAGGCRTMEEAADVMVKVKKRIRSEPDHFSYYQDKYDRYKENHPWYVRSGIGQLHVSHKKI
ncbi:L-fuculokinase [uncultured Clostridium sp.]|uniref:FGGY-family carbohydrate kinase n=1 Tax=uncultured Clostridium sp. TaxID=59620 RepID=UPI0025E98719|nr:FGGY-family carbohydrate kinase [uncultured Clostridium sp.]